MKKLYIEPNTEIVIVAVKTTLLTASDPQNQSLNKDDEQITDGNDIGSRRYNNVWDEEEEEEDY
jgi:hypothetical protein